MNFTDLKYILAYLTPLTCFVSLAFNGVWSFTSLIFLYGLVPLAEQIMPHDKSNHPEEKEISRSKSVFFDILLYLNLPILYGLVYWYLTLVTGGNMTTLDLIGKTVAVGMMSGSMGINVGHEIGHRPGLYNQWISRLLLLPSLYMHFNIEHNRGHHLNVATPEDPATSRKGEAFYAFWFRSVFMSYLSAWQIENKDLSRAGKSHWSLTNKMIIFTVIQTALVSAIYSAFGLYPVLMFVVTAILGFSLLELVNYIEHYGLVRTKSASGKYEPVQPRHSWNSDHEIGRVLLYELTRHSDHHFKSTRKYQILRHFKASPQLPLGYPGSMLLALIPPLWFKIMDKQIELQVAA